MYNFFNSAFRCGGGELLGDILKRGGVSERQIADYVKQVLEGLEYMHSRYIGHLGLTVSLFVLLI